MKPHLLFCLLGGACLNFSACSDDSDPVKKDGSLSDTLRIDQAVTTGDGGTASSNDPAPEITDPGEHGCSGCTTTSEEGFTLSLGSETSTTFSGTVEGAVGDGQYYVVNEDGQEFFGNFSTDPETGDYEVEIPLFCGTQLVKLVWNTPSGQVVLVYRVTTTDCVEPDIRLTLSWDAIGRDWELHLIKPGGKINDNLTDCTWTSCIDSSPDWGVQGDASDDPKKDVDNTGSYGPENIVLSKPEAGTYTVMVEHWSSSGDPNSNGQLVINIKGKEPVVLNIQNLAPSHVWTAATITWPSGVVTPSQEVYDCSASWSRGCKADIP